ncbi:RibD family protein [Dyella psychrodurans]|nr:RibD family protein [Dyella psychrodurans]
MHICLSAACSIDGYMDDTSNQRLILSSDEDLLDIQRERSLCDAILVGAGTLRADNPRLSIREPPLVDARLRNGLPAQPIKITLTATGNLDPNGQFFQQGTQEKIVLCPTGVVTSLKSRLDGWATVIGIDAPITARRIAHVLQERGVRHLFVEGGVLVLSLFLSEGIFDRFRLAIAPFFVGEKGISRFQLQHALVANRQERLSIGSVRLLGDTTVIDYLHSRGRQTTRHDFETVSDTPVSSIVETNV